MELCFEQQMLKIIDMLDRYAPLGSSVPEEKPDMVYECDLEVHFQILVPGD